MVACRAKGGSEARAHRAASCESCRRTACLAAIPSSVGCATEQTTPLCSTPLWQRGSHQPAQTMCRCRQCAAPAPPRCRSHSRWEPRLVCAAEQSPSQGGPVVSSDLGPPRLANPKKSQQRTAWPHSIRRKRTGNSEPSGNPNGAAPLKHKHPRLPACSLGQRGAPSRAACLTAAAPRRCSWRR